MWFHHHWFIHAITAQHKTLPLTLKEHSLFWITTAPCLPVVIVVTKMGRPLLVIRLQGSDIKFEFPILNQLICWKYPFLIDVSFYYQVWALELKRSEELCLTHWGPDKMADIFKCIIFNGIIWILIAISLKFVPKGTIDNKSSLVQVMAWCQTGNKPLPESMTISMR